MAPQNVFAQTSVSEPAVRSLREGRVLGGRSGSSAQCPGRAGCLSEHMHGKRANLQLWPKAARGLTHQPKTANPATPQAGARQQHCTTLVQVQQ